MKRILTFPLLSEYILLPIITQSENHRAGPWNLSNSLSTIKMNSSTASARLLLGPGQRHLSVGHQSLWDLSYSSWVRYFLIFPAISWAICSSIPLTVWSNIIWADLKSKGNWAWHVLGLRERLTEKEAMFIGKGIKCLEMINFTSPRITWLLSLLCTQSAHYED